MKKITIAHFVNGLHNGGVERVILNYFTHMNLENYDVHIVTQGESDKKCLYEFEKLNFHVHTVTKKSKNIFKNFKDIHSILKSNEFDIVHAHMTVTNVFPLMIAKICGIKVRINHVHLCYQKLSLVKRIMCFIGILFSTHYFACSEDAAISVFGKKMINKKKVNILNNAIEIEKFNFDYEMRMNIRNELGINDKFVIGNVARFVPQKNHKFLIDVFNEVLKYKKDAYLLLIGTGPLQEEIKSKIRDLEIEEYVEFLGSKQDVEKYYQAMDIFLLPSLFEGLGIALVEAQVSGLQCIASDRIPDAAGQTSHISFLPIDNIRLWVEKILDSNSVRKNYNREITLNGYNINIESRKLDELYNSMIGDR